jgi:hypothetical protein
MRKQATAGMLIAVTLLVWPGAPARGEPGPMLGAPVFTVGEIGNPGIVGYAIWDADDANKAGVIGYVLWEIADPPQLPELPTLPTESANGLPVVRAPIYGPLGYAGRSGILPAGQQLHPR